MPVQDISATITAGATVVGAAIAIAALVIALRQIHESRSINAQDAYLQFHKFSFDNPLFAEPCLPDLLKDKIQHTKYHWFVIYMLVCVERIVIIFPKDKSWRKAIMDDLYEHKTYICSQEFDEYIQNFSVEMQSLLVELRAREDVATASPMP